MAQTERARLDFPVSALDVALMGTLGSGRWWLPARRARSRRGARAALARVGLAEQASTRFGELSGGQRQRVAIARALVADSPVLLLDEPLGGVDPASAESITALFAELRAEGRTLLVSTHDVESARDFDLVLCLNRRQVAFGPPAEVLGREVLEQHLRQRDRDPRAATASRCGRSPSSTTSTDGRSSTSSLDPWRSGIDRRAIAEVVLLGGVLRGALASGSRSYRLSYPAESLAHGLLPGLVLAALAGAPLLLGAGGGRGRGRGGSWPLAGARRADRLRHRHRRGGVRACSASAGCWRCRPDAPARLEELLFGDPLGVSDADLVAAAALARARRRRRWSALHRPLTRRGLRPGGRRGRRACAPARVRLALLLRAGRRARGGRAGARAACWCWPCWWRRRWRSAAARAARGRPWSRARRWRSAPGVVGLYASHHLGSAAGASVALALCARGRCSARSGGLAARRRRAAA